MLLVVTLTGCINDSTNNPAQPTTIVPPAVPVPTTPGGSTTPATLPPSGFKMVTAGRDHGCIIKNSDNSLYCWGLNSDGQIGVGNNEDSSSPKNIGQTNLWQNVSGGYSHTCGVSIYEYGDPADSSHKLQLHRLLCWGDNSMGAIGYGTTVPNYYEPITLQDDDWSVVSAGNNHSCAIRLDKTLWCWGDNSNNQLGHVSANNLSPSQVTTSQDWKSIYAADQFTCALKEDNTLWCWGLNDRGQLGNGTNIDSATPLQITPQGAPGGVLPLIPLPNWKTIATGQSHVCGILSNSSDTTLDDTLWCWGGNGYGQLGNGTIIDQADAFQITANGGALTKWSAVATGLRHTCAIAADDLSLWCWGNNETGQLGIGSTAHQSEPQKISHDKGWTMVAAGESHTCAVDRDELLHCWGLDNHGQLANGLYTNTNLPRAYDLSTNWHSIASGYRHSCGLKGDSAPYTLWCDGYNDYGQVGTGSTSSQSKLTQINVNLNDTIIKTWQSLSTGPYHSCAIAINGPSRSLFCWGDNSRGQLGDNVKLDNAPEHWWPYSGSQVVVSSEDWTMITSGAHNSCGIKGQNELWCWGDNSSGQIGNGIISQVSDPPFPPTRVSGTWLTVTVGGPVDSNGGHICAIKTDGTLWCWGKNDTYQLGNYVLPSPLPNPAPTAPPTPTDLATPNQVNSDTDWVAVKAGERHTCALKNSGTLWCWGDNTHGQTGVSTDGYPFPTIITAPHQDASSNQWFDFELGTDFTCGIRNNHELWCWGDNHYKQLTSSIDKLDFFVPKVVNSNTVWQQLALGQRHGCAISEDPTNLDRVSNCWGAEAIYQFGNGTAWMSTPQPVALK